MKNRIISTAICALLIFTTACSNGGSVDNIIGADAADSNAVKMIDIYLTTEPYGIGITKEHPDLVDQINRALEDMKADGTFDEIISHYETEVEPEPVESSSKDITKDQLIVATTGDFPPFDYEIDDKYYGIDKELIKEIASRLGKELVLVNVNFDIMFISVSEHKADACIAGITITDERKEFVNFSDPYYIDGLQIAVQADNKDFDECKSAEDIVEVLKSKGSDYKVSVEANTTGEEYVKEQGLNVNVDICPIQETCLDKLKSGSIDCVIGDAAVLKYLISVDK